MNSLLDAVPKYTLGYPLSTSYKLVFYFVLPPTLLLTIYLALIATDISLVCQHFIDGNPRWATLTLIFLWWPAATSFVFTISSPTAWPADQPLSRENLRFFGLQLWYFIGFPAAVIYRYIFRIFWGLEALFAHKGGQDERMEGALGLVMEPSPLELYFFLQAYLHCAPQILLQFHILLRADSHISETSSLQLLSASASLIRMAITTATYQRFERRKILGIRYPWLKSDNTFSTQYTGQPQKHISKAPVETISNFVGLPLDLISYVGSANQSHNNDSDEDEVFEVPGYLSMTDDSLYMADKILIDDQMYSELPLKESTEAIIEKAPENSGESSENEFDNDALLDLHRTEYRIPHENQTEESPVVRDKKRLRVSIIENPDIEIRRQEHSDSRIYNIVDMSKHTTPPETPAPRPKSLAAILDIRDRIKSNAELIMDKIPRRTYKDQVDFDVPVRIRTTAIKGIEQEDGVSKFIAFISWILFLGSRMLALAAFSYFYLDVCFYICVAHYLVIVIFLMWNSWHESVNRKIFYFFLAYIYVFCIIEFKMKYRKVRLWYGLYFILVTSENFVMTAIWFWSGFRAGDQAFWFNFMALVILFSSLFSYLCFLIYFLILKPKSLTMYPLLSSQSLFPATIT